MCVVSSLGFPWWSTGPLSSTCSAPPLTTPTNSWEEASGYRTRMLRRLVGAACRSEFREISVRRCRSRKNRRGALLHRSSSSSNSSSKRDCCCSRTCRSPLPAAATAAAPLHWLSWPCMESNVTAAAAATAAASVIAAAAAAGRKDTTSWRHLRCLVQHLFVVCLLSLSLSPVSPSNLPFVCVVENPSLFLSPLLLLCNPVSASTSFLCLFTSLACLLLAIFLVACLKLPSNGILENTGKGGFKPTKKKRKTTETGTSAGLKQKPLLSLNLRCT